MKADTATVCVPELEFEIPPSTNEGSITTIENILIKSAEGLEKEQPVRKVRVYTFILSAIIGKRE